MDLKEPIENRYKFKLYNNDDIPFEYIIYFLDVIFNLTSDEAEIIASIVKKEGFVEFGNYSKELAETKLCEVKMLSFDNGIQDLQLDIIEIDNNGNL